ncbi:MAG: soxY [Betaproteobacteria bacterium]|nr:soxY [Betaproteobacteria bacterium]
MDEFRRKLLIAIGAVLPLAMTAGAGLLRAGNAVAAVWNKTGFEAKVAAEAMKSIGATGAQTSKDIILTAPDIAENGAQVPVTVTSKIPNTQSISIVVDKNPFPLNSTFDFAGGAEGYVSTKLKMGQTSNVIAVVKADGKFFTAIKEVKVTIGGCGG